MKTCGTGNVSKNSMNGRDLVLTIAVVICLAGGLVNFFTTHKTSVSRIEKMTDASRPGEKGSDQTVSHKSSGTAPPTASFWDELTPAEKILAADPTDENGRFAGLLDELCRAGQFSAALKLASEASADLQPTLQKIIFSRWAQSSPPNAMNALAAVPESAARSEAFQTIARIWAANDPSGLASYAITLPVGARQADALQVVVDHWSVLDPTAFATWLNTSPPGVDLDQAIAALISKTDGANYSPEVAVAWVENIADSDLKFNALLRVLNQWSQSQPATAQSYVANASWLTERQQKDILQILRTPSADMAVSGND